jgi:hypothetical protein
MLWGQAHAAATISAGPWELKPRVIAQRDARHGSTLESPHWEGTETGFHAAEDGVGDNVKIVLD